MLQDGLRSLGIRTDFVWVQGETRTNVSIVEADTRRYVKVNEPGPSITAAQFEEMLEKVRRLAQPGDWWVLSGSLPPGVPKDGYAQLIALLHQEGARAILDCDGEPLRLGCAARPFLVKPNDVEAGCLTGREIATPEAAVEAARAMCALGPEQVVISLGKDGAVLANAQGAWRLSGPRIQARNPIGAGDSLVGGLVWGLAQGMDVPEALAWGVACGAATASLSGTEVGSRALVEELRKEVVSGQLKNRPESRL